jgi:hypothetical protein
LALAESERHIKGHKQHPNIKEYRHYVNKFADGKNEYYIRFTVMEENTKPGKTGRNLIHSTAISEATVYKKNGNPPRPNWVMGPGAADRKPSIDKKLLGFFNSAKPAGVSHRWRVLRDTD